MKNIHEFGELNDMLERANYTCLAEEELTILLSKSNSLFGVELNVNFDDFESYAVYYRGNTSKTINKPTIFGLHYAKAVDAWERVVLLIKFKDESYFLERFNGNHQKLESLKFTPGKTYTYMYTNIAPEELRLLFPNTTIGISIKDKLILGLPILGAGIPVIIKILSQLPALLSDLQSLLIGKPLENSGIIVYLVMLLQLLVYMVILYMMTKFKHKQIDVLQNLSKGLFFKNSGAISNLEFKMNQKALSSLGISIFVMILSITTILPQLPVILFIMIQWHNNVSITKLNISPSIILSLILLIIFGCISFISYIKLKNSKIKSLKDYIDYFFFKNVEAEPRELQSLINS